jgi:hypothetical protein
MNFVKQIRGLTRTVLAGLLFLAFIAGAYAQNGDTLGKIAILPFIGGTEDEREGIAELFSFTQEIARNFEVIPRTGIISAAQQEQVFQALSGMTDADTIARLGIQFGAAYVMAGSITSLDDKKLLIVSIIKIDAIRQVAGDYLVYDSLGMLAKDKSILNSTAAKLVKMARGAGDGLNKLALVPVEFTDGANKQEGDVLAQLLAIDLLNAGKYAVYPRTKSLDQVQSEYETQLQSGLTQANEAVKAGAAVNPPYVLSVVSRKMASDTRFNASIIDLEPGEQITGKSEQYASLSDGMVAMEFLARTLSGEDISEKERAARKGTVTKEINNEKMVKVSEAEAIVRAEARDKFLKKSGVVLGGGIGLNLQVKDVLSSGGNSIDPGTGAEGNKASFDLSMLSGSGSIELRLYRFFGIQTGANLITDFAPYTPKGGGEQQYAQLSIIQIPILARLNFDLMGEGVEGLTLSLEGFAGIGLNVSAKTSDAGSVDPGKMDFIVGGDLVYALALFRMVFGYQYNGGLSGGSITVGGASYDYKPAIHTIYIGMGLYLPLRSN